MLKAFILRFKCRFLTQAQVPENFPSATHFCIHAFQGFTADSAIILQKGAGLFPKDPLTWRCKDPLSPQPRKRLQLPNCML